MADKKINRHNHPILVKARKEAYEAGRRDGYKAKAEHVYESVRGLCDITIQRLHNHYRYIIDSLTEAKINKFESIEISFDESQDMHFVSWIRLLYVYGGKTYVNYLRYTPGHKFTALEIVEDCNELIRKMLLNPKSGAVLY